MKWPHGAGVQGGPAELRVYAADPDDPPVGGISSSLLREIDIRAAADEVREAITDGERQTGPTTTLDTEPLRKRLLEQGVTDDILALVALLYVADVNRGREHPVARLAEAFGRSEVTVRSWLTRARKKGFLTGAHGKLGGRLTPEGMRVLGMSGPASDEPFLAMAARVLRENSSSSSD